MSWAEKLQSRDEPKNIPEKEPMHYLKTTIRKAKNYCQENRQDWVTFITGNEGSGKSTLASHVAEMFDPNFSVSDSMIYSFKGTNNSFINFIKKYQDTPYKVAWYDEAVTVLFSLRHSSRESADAQELFKIKRDCRHFDILVSPSFWDVVPDIRERRTKSFLYCFTEVYHPTPRRTEYKHKYAYFSGEKIIKMSLNKKAKYVFRSPSELFKVVRPDFIEEFPGMSKRIESEYMTSKRTNRISVIDRIEGVTEEEGAEKLLLPISLDFSEVKAELIKTNGGVEPAELIEVGG